MKTMMLAAAALTLSMGAAFAESEGGQESNTLFTEIPGVVAQAPAQNAPMVATAQNGQPVQVYATQSSHGTWLFAPQDGGGANN
jgi:hypothetical protein